jgi:hypothetical protein
MYGDLTRSKSNKGSVDGQFSHEFLHRQVRRGRFAGLCAGGAVRIQLYQAAERLFLHTRTSMVRSCWTSPVCLVYLVCFVYLVDLVHLVGFVQPKNQTNQIDQMNKMGWRTFSASCYSGTRISIQGGLSSTMSENRLAVLLAGIPGKTAPRRI